MRRLILFIAAVVLVAAAAIYVIYRIDLAAADARLAGGARTIETAFGPTEFAEAGSGEPVLFIHGSGGGFDQGLGMGRPLAGKGFRLIAPSRFGYLGTPMPAGGSPEMQADAFDALLAALGLDRVFIFGGSAGTLSAMQLAIRHPERCRALVLMVPAAYAPTRVPNTNAAIGPFAEAVFKAVLQSDFIYWFAATYMPDTVTRLILATDPALVHAASPAEQARVAAVREEILPISRRAEGLILDGKTAGAPVPYDLAAIACPVLTVSTEDDFYATRDPAVFIAETVRDGRSVIYPDGGHLWVGHDAEVWKAIEDFLSGR